jgi:hypothetical protein
VGTRASWQFAALKPTAKPHRHDSGLHNHRKPFTGKGLKCHRPLADDEGRNMPNLTHVMSPLTIVAINR